MDTINDGITISFVSITVFVVAFMSTERWLYMSQRALITLRRGGIIVGVMLLILLYWLGFIGVQRLLCR